MFRRLITTGAALVLLFVPGTATAAPGGDDYLTPSRPGDVLDLPPSGWFGGPPVSSQGRTSSVRTTTYGLSFVAIPVRGYRLGFSQVQVRSMARRINNRMLGQTADRFGYRTLSYSVAPRTTNSAMSCNLDRINQKYRRYARKLDNPPPGYRDTIAVYLTPLRFRCRYAGVALLGGRAVYLNGVDLRDPQRLQDWIAAHELGHTLGLEHSAAFWPERTGWQWTDAIPQNSNQQSWYDYGDYLDLMGQPPKDGYGLRGALFSRWTFNSLSLAFLGVVQRSNLTYATSSGTFQLNRLVPDSAGGRMMLAIPVIADGRKTYWVMEYRPAEENAASVNYPSPFAERGFGVRLLIAPRGLSYPHYMNRAFRASQQDISQAALPMGTPIRLGGGARVTVLATTPDSATVSVTIP